MKRRKGLLDEEKFLPPLPEQLPRGVSSLPGYGQTSPVAQGLLGFTGRNPTYSVMDPQAQKMSEAYRLGEQASVASQLYGSVAPFAVASTMANAQRAGSLLSPLTVFHGSPHKFSKFDASKIGTGEGAQAYGHGIYLAENPEIARSYQKTLSGFEQPFIQFGKSKIAGQDLSDLDLEALKYLEIGQRNAGQFPHNTLYYAKQAAKSKPDVLNRLDEFGRDVKFGYEKNQGAFYKADLPDEEIAKMLDWDKPLSQQPKAVQEALNKSEYALRDMAMDLYGRKDPLGSDIARAALKPQEFAKHMRELGIPGIRYLDQGSRGANKGTSNFVVFPGEESKVRIMEINGKPVVIDEEELMRSGLLGR